MSTHDRIVNSKEFDIFGIVIGITTAIAGIICFKKDKRFKDNK